MTSPKPPGEPRTQQGVGFDATLAPLSPVASADTVAAEPQGAEPAAHASLAGYQLGGVIGRGGMGEVVIATDQDIGRDVAIKRMRREHPSPEAVARFLREARIQARLEHPSIVPVHELGRDAAGQPYFTMKRLVGVTLAEQLVAATPPPRARLLRAFADVCTAVAFAHARGVIHRDLKPANIMLGDFGEVYVLDWGLARVVGTGDAAIASDIDSLDGSAPDGPSDPAMTQAGAVLGTPGYMAPEQVFGAADVATPADVYALGAILFEILAGEPLHPRGTAAVLSTASGAADPSPAARQPDRATPPELDALCVSALTQTPAERPSASALAEAVRRYLDGDRDLERRRQLADEWLGKARAALAADPVGQRAEAARCAGRALALDPESTDAGELATSLLLTPPRELPPELRAELAHSEGEVQRRQSRVARTSFAAIAVVLALSAWNGLQSAPTLVAIAALGTILTASAVVLSRRHGTHAEMLVVAIGNATLAALISRMFGSLVVAPATTCVMAVSLTSYPQLIDRGKLVIALLLASWAIPVALERVGALQSTWSVDGDHIVSTSAMFSLAGGATSALVIATNLMTILVIGLFANALARSRRDAQRTVEIQAWHLRQWLPRAGRAS